MNFNRNNFRFPVWQYLNQHVFDSNRPLILSPHRFWRRHHIHHLERCWFSSHPEERFRN